MFMRFFVGQTMIWRIDFASKLVPISIQNAGHKKFFKNWFKKSLQNAGI